MSEQHIWGLSKVFMPLGVAKHHILSFMVCLDFGIPEDPTTG